MTTLYSTGNANKGYSGYVLYCVDGTTTPVWDFQADQVSFPDTDNTAYPELIDNAAIRHNVVLGTVAGTVAQSGPVQLDRGWDTFLTAGYGPRTNGKLTDMTATKVSNAGASAVNYGNIYWEQVDWSGRFGMRGDVQMLNYRLQGMVMDPRGVGTPPTLSPPGTSGLTGVNISSFTTATFSDGATPTPNVYDLIRSIDFSLLNGMDPVPVMSDTVNRLSPGCVPSTLIGTMTLRQLEGAANALPATTGQYPLQIKVKSGDGAHTLTLNWSLNFDSKVRRQVSRDYNEIECRYTVFGTNSLTAAYPFSTSYA